MRRLLLVVLTLGLAAGIWSLSQGVVSCEVVSAQPACQVALRPGPAEDTFGLIEVDGAPSYASSGEFLLTTIAIEDDLGLLDWLRAATTSSVDTVPRDHIYPPGIDRDEVAEQNAVMMADSQLTATLVALAQAGYDVTGDGALVAAVTDDAVTDDLEEGDVIVAVDGAAVTGSGDVVDAVRARDPGDRLELSVDRDGRARTVAVTLGRSPDEPDRAYIGVLLTTDIELPVDISIDAGIVGGPSAGLMFTLSILDLLEPDDLTGGAVVAGTGTVNREGAVGSVGGVAQKVVGATLRAGERPAGVFLLPRDNLAEARQAIVDREVLLVPVDTVDDALDALAELRAGRQPADALAVGPTATPGS